MNFVTMQQDLSDRVGAYDNSISADLTKLKRWLNMGQSYICSKYNWPFMIDYEIVQTTPDITTGTVSINAQSTSGTFSSAPVASVSGWYIKFSTTDDWYKVTAHTAASTSFTISPAYVDTSNLTAGTYTLRKLLYSTTTPFDSYLTVSKTVNPTRLTSLNRRMAEFVLPLYLDSGDPIDYIMGPMDSSGNLQFSLFQSPNTTLNLLIVGIKKLTDLSSDSDTSVIPARWHDAIIDVGEYYAFKSLDDNRAKESLSLADSKIEDMKTFFNTDLGRHRVMQPVDQQSGYAPIYVLPPNFGPWVYK